MKRHVLASLADSGVHCPVHNFVIGLLFTWWQTNSNSFVYKLRMQDFDCYILHLHQLLSIPFEYGSPQDHLIWATLYLPVFSLLINGCSALLGPFCISFFLPPSPAYHFFPPSIISSDKMSCSVAFERALSLYYIFHLGFFSFQCIGFCVSQGDFKIFCSIAVVFSFYLYFLSKHQCFCSVPVCCKSRNCHFNRSSLFSMLIVNAWPSLSGSSY